MDDIKVWSGSIAAVVALAIVHLINTGKLNWAFSDNRVPERLKGHVVWWEYFLVIIPSLVICPLLAACGTWSAAVDTEYWGSYPVTAVYYEDWNEYIHQTCTRTVSCGKDCTTTETYDCSYVAYYPPKWEATDQTGVTHSITEADYRMLASKFGNEQFVDLHRAYYSNDGDKYVTNLKSQFNPDSNKIAPICTSHWYENRVAVAHSVWSYPEVTDKEKAEYKLFAYHKQAGIFDDQCFMSVGSSVSAGDVAEANSRLSKWNSSLGPRKQIRIMFLLFPEDSDRQSGILQEAIWKGGNKNEFVVCIGVNSNKTPKWCHVFSWCEQDDLKVDVRTRIENTEAKTPLTIETIKPLVDYVANECESRFIRKDFGSFAYLSVPCPIWSVVVCWIMNIAVTGLVSMAVFGNDHRN